MYTPGNLFTFTFFLNEIPCFFDERFLGKKEFAVIRRGKNKKAPSRWTHADLIPWKDSINEGCLFFVRARISQRSSVGARLEDDTKKV